jgi:uncharacterized protein involved in exopolysaccharide biosynthesis
MTGSAEDRLDALEARIAELERRRAEVLTLIENEARSDEGTTEAEQRLQEIEDELAALRILTATFTSARKHS